MIFKKIITNNSKNKMSHQLVGGWGGFALEKSGKKQICIKIRKKISNIFVHNCIHLRRAPVNSFVDGYFAEDDVEYP